MIATDSRLDAMEALAKEVYEYDLYRDTAGQFEIRKRFVREFCADIRPIPLRARRHSGLRIGYLGSDFRAWSGTWIYGGVILKPSAGIESYCYSYALVDYHEQDGLNKLYRERTHWRDVEDLTPEQVADLIDADEIDILVDLMGYTHGLPLSILAYKPAPVVVTAWGHVSGGTGLSTVDGLFADPVACPQAIRHHYTERIIDLPCIVSYFPPPYLPEPVRRPGPFVFGMPHRFAKVTKRALRLWAEILRHCPDAELHIKSVDLDGESDHDTLRAELRAQCEGICDRIRIETGGRHREHLAAFQTMDVVLDTLPFNGGVVSLESLAMGVPFITRPGAFLASRVGASILHAVGLGNWIAHTDQEYIDLAVAAYQQADELREQRVQLRMMLGQSPICANYVHAVDCRYRELAK